MATPKYVTELRARLDQIDANVVQHLDRILDGQQQILKLLQPVGSVPTPAPTPAPSPTPGVESRPGLQAVKEAVAGMTLVGAGDNMMRALQGQAGEFQAINYAIAINDRWPDQWRSGLSSGRVNQMRVWLCDLGLISDCP